MFSEICVACPGFDEWETLSAQCAFLKDPDYIQDLAKNIQLTGFVDPFNGIVRSDEFLVIDENYREGFQAHGANSRSRGILKEVLDYVLTYGRCSTIYMSEQVSAFAEAVKMQFPYLVTSEYVANPIVRWKLSHIRHEDPVRLSLPDHAFDLYISPDNMVFAVDMQAFLTEARRILRRTGVLIATFPFRYGEKETTVLAEMIGGKITHHHEPQYADDPLDGKGKRLLYFVPGWDILDAARNAGFRSAEIVVHSSRTNAILGAEIAAVFVLKAIA